MRNLTKRGDLVTFAHFWEQKMYRIKEKKERWTSTCSSWRRQPKTRVRGLHRNQLLSCEQFPAFTEGKSYRKQQQQQQQKQQQHCNKEIAETWDSSDDSDRDLSQLIPPSESKPGGY